MCRMIATAELAQRWSPSYDETADGWFTRESELSLTDRLSYNPQPIQYEEECLNEHGDTLSDRQF